MKRKLLFDSVVAETLLIPLYMRALENRRPDAVLRDPDAERMVADIDYDFAALDKARMSVLGCVVRSRYHDDCVRAFACERRNPIVVDVGCGLDARARRLADLTHARFYGLDLPEVVRIRSRLLPDTPAETTLEGSALDVGWLDMLHQRHPDGDFIFIFEGVLMYFRPEQFHAILHAVASRFGGGELCFDVCGPMMVHTGLKPDSLRGHAAQIRSGVADGREVERHEPLLRLVEQRIYMELAPRRWGFVGVFFRAFPRLARQFSSLLRFRIAEDNGR